MKDDGEESPRRLFAEGLEQLRGLFGEGWAVEAAPGSQQDASDWYADRFIETAPPTWATPPGTWWT